MTTFFERQYARMAMVLQDETPLPPNTVAALASRLVDRGALFGLESNVRLIVMRHHTSNADIVTCDVCTAALAAISVDDRPEYPSALEPRQGIEQYQAEDR